ncbi:Polysulfide reductase [Rubrivivax sp. A210]|uniref:NrfD/PsrC family molybdoenzyme membrane anchor subunit n=1 Tax=Rubrivivax sp. A210 TaxID=2772301 RepID=UPI00191A2B6E|nr:NrfD/PsrC family molybdoenzyme membrane anchor subunit [Rubrivivax sp. A210]CAD5373908.1 Polysulfide reductase [Rubrivivax sp. A210]
MLEITSSRHNPLIDPQLAIWSWEIPIYLFLGGAVAGMMVLGGVALLRAARGDDGRSFFSMHTPLLGFVLMNVGMLALLLDLAHRMQVWRIYTSFQPTSPMSWGSWVLILVYGVLLASALVRLPETWPWLADRVPAVRRGSQALVDSPAALRALALANIGLGVGLGIYTGILLDTLVARPLWNSAILGPLFLFSGLSAGAAMVHLLAVLMLGRPASTGLVGGALASLLQPVAAVRPERQQADALIRADILFLAIELLLIGLLVVNLHTSSASHAAAAGLIMSGAYALPFWGGVVGLGIVLPIAWQALELAHKLPHTVVPALLVMAGGYTLRWVMVGAGQASEILPVLSLAP